MEAEEFLLKRVGESQDRKNYEENLMQWFWSLKEEKKAQKSPMKEVKGLTELLENDSFERN